MFDATPHQPVTIREANDPGLWLAGAIELLSMLPAQYYARGFAEKSRTTAAGGRSWQRRDGHDVPLFQNCPTRRSTLVESPYELRYFS